MEQREPSARFAVAWAVLAVAILFAAGTITHRLTSPYPALLGSYLGAYGDYRKPETATFSYEDFRTPKCTVSSDLRLLNCESVTDRRWRVSFPAGTRLIVLPGPIDTDIGAYTARTNPAPPMKCRVTDERPRIARIGASRVDLTLPTPLEIVRDDLSYEAANGVASGTQGVWVTTPEYVYEMIDVWMPGRTESGTLQCGIDTPLVQRVSYAEFAADVRFRPGDPPHATLRSSDGPRYNRGLRPAQSLVSIGVEGAKNVQIFGGRFQSDSASFMSPSDELRISFDDDTLGNERDAWFVVVGALIALGAAMVLEALRPFVGALMWPRRRRT